MLDCAREDPDDEEDALAARLPALFRPSSPWASISIHGDLSSCISARAFWKFSLPHTPPRTGRQAKAGSQHFHKECEVVLAVWRNQHTGTFCASDSGSEGEPRISGDKSQCTDRYSIASGRSRAPFASTNLLLAISTRSSPGLSSHGESTWTVPEKVHAVPLTRKPLRFPWLSRNLFVFLGSLFSLVSYLRFMQRNAALDLSSFPTPTQLLLSVFSTVIGLPILPVQSLVSAVSTIPCRVLPQNCKKILYDRQEQE